MFDAVELKQAFDRDGYVHIRDYLKGEELAELRRAVDRYKCEIIPSLGREEHRALYDVIDGTPHLKHLVEMHESDDYFAGMLYGERASGCASILLGEAVVARTVEYFEKAPRVGKATPAHQDGFYFCLNPNHAVTFWLALDDCDCENGCLHYVRGSHRKGLIDHGSSGVTGFSQGLAGVPWRSEDVSVLVVKAGDLLAHHSLMIHYADANQSLRQRRSIGMVYYGCSAQRDEAAWQRYQDNLKSQREAATA